MKALVTLLVLAAISAGIFTLGTLRGKEDNKSILHVAQEVPLTVSVAKPAKEEIIRLVQAPGDVEAVVEVEISSEIVAKIEELPVEEGDLVKKGDLLCRLDDNNLLAEVESGQARIAQLRAAILQSDADLEKAERDLARQVTLSETDSTSDLELRDYKTVRDKMKAVREMSQQELVQAEAGLKRIQENLSRTVIRSPLDGIVSKLVAELGEVVITGTMNNPGTVIMTISDLSKMQVRARVDEVDIPLVQPGQKARVYLQSDQDKPVAAKIIRVASKGNKPVGREVVTFEALMEVLSNEARIKPGMTANVEIEVDKRGDAITIPVEAIVNRMRKDLPESTVKEFDRLQAGVDLSDRVKQAQYIKVVYVMENDAAKVRVVDTGIADSRRVELRNGVGLDDTVITGPYRSLDQLKEGKKVALAEKDKKKPEDAAKTEEESKTAADDKDKKEEDTKKDDKDDPQSSTASAKP